MRTIDKTSFSTSKKAGLTINLKPETVSEKGNPSFVGKRQQHLFSSAETIVDFYAKTEKEQAGLVIFQDEKHYYFMAKTQKGGKSVIQLIKSKNKETEVIAESELSVMNTKTGIKIESKGDSYSFYFSEDGKTWKLLKDKVDGKFLSTKVAGGFIGCIYGMYATSNGEKSENKASFKFLRYEGNDPMYK
jgi:alpha-N-arabinofuranosidase